MKKAVMGVFVFILTVIAIMVIVAQMLPGAYSLQEEELIAMDAQHVFPLIADCTQWEKWSPWKAEDPSVEMTATPGVVKVGDHCSWNSKKMGSGTMTITKVESPTELHYDVSFGSSGSPIRSSFVLAPAGAQMTRVEWNMGTP